MSSIYAKIEKGNYRYLTKPKRPANRCKNGHYFLFIVNNVPNFCLEYGVPVKEEHAKRLDEYAAALKTYYKARSKVNQIFKRDALEHCGLADHLRRR